MSKILSECPEIEVQDIDHLGIVAGIVDEIGIVELIYELIPSYELQKISAGQIVKAVILNCMAFITAPMYLLHQFFEGKATEHLGLEARIWFCNKDYILSPGSTEICSIA